MNALLHTRDTQCGGFGWHTDSRDVDHPCHACATTGRVS